MTLFMSLDAPSPLSDLNPAGLRLGLVCARFNHDLVEGLRTNALQVLSRAGVTEEQIVTCRVPGSNELPAALRLLLDREPLDACLALGVIIRGDTLHFELIARSVSDALHHLAMDSRVPIINGVVVAETTQQARDRCLGSIPRGHEFGSALLEMAALRTRLGRPRT
ncbi:MAG: 6,7-dimethyl-8-ribityllumazine synthase [Puniceicoccaceae bacterium]|nr:MAG: 6,7-dimethyl-8-ribityllumazine synthase [Puniceicoccaceae bacterium]